METQIQRHHQMNRLDYVESLTKLEQKITKIHITHHHQGQARPR